MRAIEWLSCPAKLERISQSRAASGLDLSRFRYEGLHNLVVPCLLVSRYRDGRSVQGTSLVSNHAPPGPYGRPLPTTSNQKRNIYPVSALN